MAVINENWYALNAGRKYPLADTATGTGDAGERLPNDILVDCNIRFPQTYGAFAYVGGVTVTNTLITIVILAAEFPDSVAGFQPLAAVTLRKPAVPGRHYAITPLVAGVGGWVVFGQGIRTNFSGRFSLPSQGLLLPRVALARPPLPIPSLGKSQRDVALTELITLKAGKDVEIVKESRVIDGELRDALVIRLVAATANDNPLSRYIGPCGTRPESENCNKVAVQGINTVGPDCDGNIDLEFRGVRSTPLEDNGPGVVLDHNLDLAEVCAAGKPEETVYQDLCESETSSGSSDAPSSGGPTPPDASSSLSSEAELCVDLPYLETFDDQATPMETIRGTFVFEEEDSPDEPFEPIGSSLASLSASASSEVAFGESWSLVAIDGSRDNLCLLPHCSDGNVERLVSAEMQLTRERVACNGGLILNYHETGDPDDRHIEYFLVLLDVTNVRFSIIRFNGQRYIIEQSVTVLPSDLNLWLHVEAEIAPGPDPETQTTITASIRTVGTPPELAATLTLTTNRYLPADGRFGVATREAKTRFSYFAIE